MASIVLLCFSLSILVVACTSTHFPAHAPLLGNNTTACSLATWMTCASAPVRMRSIVSLAIPGSHDSFAYWLDADPSLSLAPDISSWQTRLLSVMSIFFGPRELRSILRDWSLTQSLDVTQQLEAGVRYFDIRLAYEPRSAKIRFVHMLWGLEVMDELEKVHVFLRKHPREIVLLDFNHFYDMTEDHHVLLAGRLLAKFGEKMVSFSTWNRLRGITLGRLQAKGLQVIIVYHNGHGVHASKNHFWPDGAAISPWPETDDIDDLIGFLNKNANNRTNFMQSFFVYQGVLTPSGFLVARRFGTGSLYGDLASLATPAFVSWMKLSLFDDGDFGLPTMKKNHQQIKNRQLFFTLRRDKTFDKVAICMADFVEVANFTNTVVQLNYHKSNS